MALKKRRPPAVAVPRQRHVVAVVLHPNDDQAEARPGVEPSMYKVEFWRAALHAHSREGGHEQSAEAVDVAWQGRPPSLEPSEGEYGAGVRTVYGCFVRPALTIICVQSPSSADPVKVMLQPQLVQVALDAQGHTAIGVDCPHDDPSLAQGFSHRFLGPPGRRLPR